MSVTGLETPPSSAAVSAPSLHSPIWKRALIFGAGFGIAIGEKNLEVAIVRARPSGPQLAATAIVSDFRERPAAEWGAELQRFLAAAGENRLAATVLLPRDEVIVRTVGLPGVADRDVANAIELQMDSLHPWGNGGGNGGGDTEIVWGWSRAGRDGVLVGLVRKEFLDAWETLFAEAGISLAALTFSTTVIHAALRIWNVPSASLLCYVIDSRGRTEIYGESESRAIFSAEFSMASERALALARAELRLPAGAAAMPLDETLPSEDAPVLAYAAAVVGASARAAKFANLLPVERRASRIRLPYVTAGIFAVLLVLALIAADAVFPALEQRRYLTDLNRQTRLLEPSALRAQSLEKQTAANKAKIAVLDDFRSRPQADLDILNELTRLLPPPIWTTAIEIYPDSVVISGEAEQAAPLLKVLDSSPLFQNSEFPLSVTRNDKNEVFRIKTMRRGRTGRTTP
jgi:Tfp pilus assembly protein PilN